MNSYIVDLASIYVWMFAFGMFLKKCWDSYLAWREKNYVLSTEITAYDEISSLHSCAKDFFTPENLKTSLLYERTVNAFNVFEHNVFARYSLLATLFGLKPFILFLFWHTCNLPFWLAIVCSIVSMSLLEDILSIPFDYYNTFKLEEKFGFNTTTVKTFVTDFFKNLGVSSIFTFCQMTLLVLLLQTVHSMFGRIDWKICLALTIITTLGSMVMEIIYLKLILPLFNKLSPMKDSPLKTRMEKMMTEFGFNSKGVFVIDASKRSKHSNAYCTGWGKNKKLVLFDTLLKNFTDDEIMAILGHELAHAKLNHLVINRVVSFIETFVFYFISPYFIYNASIYHAFGYSYVTNDNIIEFAIVGFWLFSTLYNSYRWILDGIDSWISRKMEYAADRYSCIYNGNIEPMITSLFKLYGENLTYPLSDSLYESWNFSHPGLVNRVKALNNLNQK